MAIPIDQQLDCAPHLVGEIADQPRIVGSLGSETLVVAERLAVNDPVRDGVGEHAERTEPRKRRRNRRYGKAESASQRFDVEEDRRLVVAPDERHRNDRRARAQRVLDEAHAKLLESIAVCDRLAHSLDAFREDQQQLSFLEQLVEVLARSDDLSDARVEEVDPG